MTTRDEMERIGKTLGEFHAEMGMVTRVMGERVTGLTNALSELNEAMDKVWEKVAEIEQRLNEEWPDVPPVPHEEEEPETILVIVENENDANCSVYSNIPDGRDKSCGSGEKGKPEYGSNKVGRFENGQRFRILSKFKDNCHDNSNDPWIHGAYGLYAVVADPPFQGCIVPAKRITLLA